MPLSLLHLVVSRSRGRRRKAVFFGVMIGVASCLPGWCPMACGAIVTIYPSQDNSIYSESDTSNALGQLYSGMTPLGPVRRALLEFDVAASGIPSGSVIDSVSLDLVLTKIGAAGSTAATFQLHPIFSAWGEGRSSGSGTGGVATPTDATWNYRLFNTSPWIQPGGDISLLPSGTTSIGVTVGTAYTFSSQAGLVADVQNWLDNPGSNNGWILRATDELALTAREFGSRETIQAQRPVLTVSYTPVPEPGTIGFLGAAVIALAARRSGWRRNAATAR